MITFKDTLRFTTYMSFEDMTIFFIEDMAITKPFPSVPAVLRI